MSALNQAHDAVTDAVHVAKSGCLRAIFYDLVARYINYFDESEPFMSQRAKKWNNIVQEFEQFHSANLDWWHEVSSQALAEEDHGLIKCTDMPQCVAEIVVAGHEMPPRYIDSRTASRRRHVLIHKKAV